MKRVTADGRKNRRETSERGCLLCGAAPSDPHHWPVRQSHGAGDSQLEMVPLCRRCHSAVHDGDVRMIEQLQSSGHLYHAYLKLIGVE